MKLSILIPVYNAEEHIGRCLDSLLDQNISSKDYEIILRDDGSTDQSIAVINKYCKENSNISLYKDTNKGAYVQRNLLLEQANGEYIYFVDADDYLVRQQLYKLLRLVYNHDLDVCGFGIQLTSSNFEGNSTPAQDSIKLQNPEVLSGILFLEKYEEMRYEIWWMLIKKNLLIGSQIKFDEGRYHNDVIFTLRVLLNAQRVVYIPDVIYCYFQSQGSIMRDSSRKHLQKLIAAGKKLIYDLNHLVIEVNEKYDREKLLYNLKYARGKFAFYLIVRMVKAGCNLKELNDIIQYLKTINSYPIRYYKGKDMSRKKFVLLYLLVNNKFLLKGYLKYKKQA